METSQFLLCSNVCRAWLDIAGRPLHGVRGHGAARALRGGRWRRQIDEACGRIHIIVK